MAVDPAKFIREVRTEMTKVTWPSRQETLKVTGLVFVMSFGAAVFFFLIDQIAGFGVRTLFGSGI